MTKSSARRSAEVRGPLVPKLLLRHALVFEAPLRHRAVMRSRYLVLEPARPHFITATIVEWLPVFTTEATSWPAPGF